MHEPLSSECVERVLRCRLRKGGVRVFPRFTEDQSLDGFGLQELFAGLTAPGIELLRRRLRAGQSGSSQSHPRKTESLSEAKTKKEQEMSCMHTNIPSTSTGITHTLQAITDLRKAPTSTCNSFEERGYEQSPSDQTLPEVACRLCRPRCIEGEGPHNLDTYRTVKNSVTTVHITYKLFTQRQLSPKLKRTSQRLHAHLLWIQIDVIQSLPFQLLCKKRHHTVRMLSAAARLASPRLAVWVHLCTVTRTRGDELKTPRSKLVPFPITDRMLEGSAEGITVSPKMVAETLDRNTRKGRNWSLYYQSGRNV